MQHRSPLLATIGCTTPSARSKHAGQTHPGKESQKKYFHQTPPALTHSNSPLLCVTTPRLRQKRHVVRRDTRPSLSTEVMRRIEQEPVLESWDCVHLVPYSSAPFHAHSLLPKRQKESPRMNLRPSERHTHQLSRKVSCSVNDRHKKMAHFVE